MNAAGNNGTQTESTRLTPELHATLALVASGIGTKAIAARLGICNPTVRRRYASLRALGHLQDDNRTLTAIGRITLERGPRDTTPPHHDTVERLFAERGVPLSSADVAAVLERSKAQVMEVLRRLESWGVVRMTADRGASTGGRRPVMFELVRRHGQEAA